MTKKTLDQSIADLAAIYEDGTQAGYLTATSQLHLAKVHRSLMTAKAGSKSAKEAQKLMPILDRIKKGLDAKKEAK